MVKARAATPSPPPAATAGFEYFECLIHLFDEFTHAGVIVDQSIKACMNLGDVNGWQPLVTSIY